MEKFFAIKKWFVIAFCLVNIAMLGLYVGLVNEILDQALNQLRHDENTIHQFEKAKVS